jgi:hypothetical protein
MKNLKNKIFPLLIAFSALSVSASAAFYSVSGLSKLFAGASLQVIIMASSLEIAKLVIASLLYQYWDKLNKLLRVYLTIAAAVLILITSMGIYGFLSAAYQETANKAGNVDAQVTLVETKRDNIKEQLAVYTTEKESINKAVADLRAGLANNVITYTDKNGNLITTTSSATRKALEKQLDQAIERQTNINTKVDELNTQLFDYETEIVDISTNSELAGELGPLKYLSGLTGVPMDKIINVLLLVIIFVFDPLAIALVVAANFAFAQLRPKKDEFEFLHEEEIDNPEYKEWEEATINDGLEEEWDEDHALDQVLNDIVEDSDVWGTIEEEPQIEVKMSGEPSLNILNEEIEGVPVMFDPKTGKLFYQSENNQEPTEELPPQNQLTKEEAKHDLNNDGILDDQEQARLKDDKLLNTQGISSWRRKKIQNYLDGNTKRYF